MQKHNNNNNTNNSNNTSNNQHQTITINTLHREDVTTILCFSLLFIPIAKCLLDIQSSQEDKSADKRIGKPSAQVYLFSSGMSAI